MKMRTWNSDPTIEARKENLQRQIVEVIQRHKEACEAESKSLVDELVGLMKKDNHSTFIIDTPTPDHPRCGDCGMYKGECECN